MYIYNVFIYIYIYILYVHIMYLCVCIYIYARNIDYCIWFWDDSEMTVLSASGWLFLAAERRLFRHQEWQRYHDFVCKSFKHQRQWLFRSCQSCDFETWCSCVCLGVNWGLGLWTSSVQRLAHSNWTCRCPGPQDFGPWLAPTKQMVLLLEIGKWAGIPRRRKEGQAEPLVKA